MGVRRFSGSAWREEKLDDSEFEALEKGEVASSAGKSSGFGEAVGMLTLRRDL